eukprot:173731-Chlamydomonas_euryale.AAC.5
MLVISELQALHCSQAGYDTAIDLVAFLWPGQPKCQGACRWQSAVKLPSPPPREPTWERAFPSVRGASRQFSRVDSLVRAPERGQSKQPDCLIV